MDNCFWCGIDIQNAPVEQDGQSFCSRNCAERCETFDNDTNDGPAHRDFGEPGPYWD